MSPQSSWILQEEIAPRLRSAIPNNVNRVGSEDAQELIQDSIVMAAKLLTRRGGGGLPVDLISGGRLSAKAKIGG